MLALPAQIDHAVGNQVVHRRMNRRHAVAPGAAYRDRPGNLTGTNRRPRRPLPQQRQRSPPARPPSPGLPAPPRPVGHHGIRLHRQCPPRRRRHPALVRPQPHRAGPLPLQPGHISPRRLVRRRTPAHKVDPVAASARLLEIEGQDGCVHFRAQGFYGVGHDRETRGQRVGGGRLQIKWMCGSGLLSPRPCTEVF